MEDAHPVHATRRYALVAVFVTSLAILATILLTALVLGIGNRGAVAARIDSPRVHDATHRARATRHVTLAIAPVIAPRQAYAAWAQLAAQLEQSLDIEISVVHRRTYAEIDELLDGPDAVIALVCSGPYVRQRRRGAVRLLAIPKIGGHSHYNSHVIVPADSAARSMKDLRGHVFAFSDPLSNSGTLYPRFLVSELGDTAEHFFVRTVFTYGHDRSIRSVANGLVDGAAVDSLVYDSMQETDPEVIRRVRIIHTSAPFGMNPVIANRRTPPDLADKLRTALLTLDDSEQGRAMLASLGIDEMSPGNPADYRSIEAMLRVIEP